MGLLLEAGGIEFFSPIVPQRLNTRCDGIVAVLELIQSTRFKFNDLRAISLLWRSYYRKYQAIGSCGSSYLLEHYELGYWFPLTRKGVDIIMASVNK
jgi:hypothetical protein